MHLGSSSSLGPTELELPFQPVQILLVHEEVLNPETGTIANGGELED